MNNITWKIQSNNSIKLINLTGLKLNCCCGTDCRSQRQFILFDTDEKVTNYNIFCQKTVGGFREKHETRVIDCQNKIVHMPKENNINIGDAWQREIGTHYKRMIMQTSEFGFRISTDKHMTLLGCDTYIHTNTQSFTKQHLTF